MEEPGIMNGEMMKEAPALSKGREKKVWLVFCRAGKLKPYRCGSLDLKPGDTVVAITEKGPELGLVVKGPVEMREIEPRIPAIERMATQEDKDQWMENQCLAKEAFLFCGEKIKERELPMKLVDVSCALDKSKIVFYFSAEGRVDFRALVKDLAKRFRARIEMRQIGIRDEAKKLGGIGPCGKEVCCAQFIREFEPVSIRMAKDQYLILNPSKISGLCGRLMCCLCFEHDTYREASNRFPKVGEKVVTQDGHDGEVVSISVIEEKVIISLGNAQGQLSIPLFQIMRKQDLEETRGKEEKGEPPVPSLDENGEKETPTKRREKKRGKGISKERHKEAPEQ
jgi:cell fate regulator YaaT (PSP1 superfamily)